jgi:hypothetical protein
MRRIGIAIGGVLGLFSRGRHGPLAVEVLSCSSTAVFPEINKGAGGALQSLFHVHVVLGEQAAQERAQLAKLERCGTYPRLCMAK